MLAREALESDRSPARRSPQSSAPDQRLYQTEAVGIPQDVVAALRHAPVRPALEEIAHALAYDATIIGDLTLPTELIASVTTPTLVIDGEKSPPLLRNAAQALTDTLPSARRVTLAGQTHDIAPEPTAAAIAEFLQG
jgi:pimeloyl-ACP methyl ester carboxylesterase